MNYLHQNSALGQNVDGGFFSGTLKFEKGASCQGSLLASAHFAFTSVFTKLLLDPLVYCTEQAQEKCIEVRVPSKGVGRAKNLQNW